MIYLSIKIMKARDATLHQIDDQIKLIQIGDRVSDWVVNQVNTQIWWYLINWANREKSTKTGAGV